MMWIGRLDRRSQPRWEGEKSRGGGTFVDTVYFAPVRLAPPREALTGAEEELF